MLRLLSLLILPSLFWAQSKTLEVAISDWQRESGKYLSSTFELTQDNRAYGFIGLSAYSTDSMQSLSLSWRYRVGDEWSTWIKLSPPHEGQAKNRVAYIAPPLEEAIEAWQLSCASSVPKKLIARLFIAPPAHEKKKLSLARIDSLNCSCPPPPICNRNCWCPSGNCPPPNAYTTTSPTHLIVHHSAGFTNYNDYQWVVAYYWDLHVNTNGWSDIGYNWLIDPNGVVYEGRGSGHLGSHFSCMNSGTLGICFIGNYVSNSPARAGLQKLSEILLYEACQNSINLNDSSLHQSSLLNLRHISGHMDANPATVGCPSGTACPGTQLYQKLDSLAQALSQSPCYLSSSAFSVGDIEIAPNPSPGLFRLKGLQNGEKLIISNSAGEIIKEWNYAADQPLDLQNQAPGLYLLRMKSSPQRSFKLIIQ